MSRASAGETIGKPKIATNIRARSHGRISLNRRKEVAGMGDFDMSGDCGNFASHLALANYD